MWLRIYHIYSTAAIKICMDHYRSNLVQNVHAWRDANTTLLNDAATENLSEESISKRKA